MRKCLFNPRDRPLQSTDLIKRVKKENLPAPNAYNPKQEEKSKLTLFSKVDKSTAFIDAAIDHAMQSPGVTYKDTTSLVNDTTHPKIFKYKFNEPKTRTDDFKLRPKKST